MAGLINIVIVSHQSRRDMAQHLADRVMADHIFEDNGNLGCEANHRQAWEWHQHNTPEGWAVVLEDDAEPINNFRAELNRALAAAPTDIVSLYLGRQRPFGGWQSRIRLATTEAKRTGAHWIRSNHCLHAVAIAIRTDLLPTLQLNTNLVADDAITAWAQHHRHDIAYSWPSLVNHNDGQSITEHRDRRPRTPGRIAWATGTRRRWNSRTIEMRGHPLRQRSQLATRR